METMEAMNGVERALLARKRKKKAPVSTVVPTDKDSIMSKN